MVWELLFPRRGSMRLAFSLSDPNPNHQMNNDLVSRSRDAGLLCFHPHTNLERR